MRTTPVNGKLELSAVISHLDKYYAAFCPELDLASLGENVEDALENLEKIIRQNLFYSTAAKHYRLEPSMVKITKVFITD